MAPHEQSIARQSMQSGRPLPDRIANAPELKTGLQLYLQSFFDLDTDRQAGFAAMPIPYSTIRNYAVGFEFDEEQTSDLFFFVRSMDNAYLKWLDSKRPK